MCIAVIWLCDLDLSSPEPKAVKVSLSDDGRAHIIMCIYVHIAVIWLCDLNLSSPEPKAVKVSDRGQRLSDTVQVLT